MRKIIVSVFLVLACASLAPAHFGQILPSDDIVTPDENRTVTLTVRFAHPFEQGLMDMEPPAQFGALAAGKAMTDLPPLETRAKDGKRFHVADVKLNRPGDYVFFVEPKPYWEPTEDKFIVHYAKVIVQAFGLEEGWDALAGLPIEIRPLTRPYGLWTGNVFTGQVMKNGQPLPGAEIEISYENEGGAVKAPAEAYTIQVVQADENGVFSYAMPRAGWWGFAALAESDKQLKDPDGVMKPVEIGGVLWVRTRDMQ
ncbi:MAG: DUF4198 domain-containing protein [Deltaproteobacteria bacterium]|nr:DUF4198 domain-containing protein [Deltaproteobacteria bacterium]